MNLRASCDWVEVGRTVLAATCVSLLFPSLDWGSGITAFPVLFRDFVNASIFSNCIGIPATLVPWQYLESRSQGLARWMVRFGILIALAIAGSAVANGIFLLIGWLPPHFFIRAYLTRLPIAILLTLLVGIAMIVYESMRGQLQETALELRTHELERERAMKLVTEARLSSLESRIHPHFLFNTLNSISSLIPEDPGRAEKLVEQMAALLRFSLDSTRDGLVPLERELKIVNAYLEIEKSRLGDRLRYEVICPSDVNAVAVPPLAIQTLVENTIKHVIAPSRTGGWLEVSVARSNGTVNLAVRDSGPGFDIKMTPAGHGLDNLRGRMNALYGAAASIDATRDGETASVCVSIPVSNS
jgi:LytS/YehU family sensor histidine kinase